MLGKNDLSKRRRNSDANSVNFVLFCYTVFIVAKKIAFMERFVVEWNGSAGFGFIN